MRRNFMFEEKIAYTFEEMLTLPEYERIVPFTDDELTDVFALYGLINVSIAAKPRNVWNFSYIKEMTREAFKDYIVALYNKIWLRYKDHYAIICNKPLEEDRQEFDKKAKDFMTKIANIVDYTYERYSTLLDLYTEQKDHLLDKLGKTRSGNRNVQQEGQNAENSVDLFNDTPQTTDVVATLEGNQYVSELNKRSVAGSTASNGSDNFQEAETWDNATIMARLDEIEKQFSQHWRNWLNEFDQLFIEEVNY